MRIYYIRLCLEISNQAFTLFQAALSRRKESAAPLTTDRDGSIFHPTLTYPLALVLRLRVLQVIL